MDLTEQLDKKLDRLLRLGLADKQRVQYYENVMSNLKTNINVAQYRPIILKVLEKLIDNTINDPMIYQKTQQNLLRQNGYMKEEKKMKKSTRIPPTQRNDGMLPDTSSCDVQDSAKYEETNTVTSLIKCLVREKLLTEVLGAGTALGRGSVGAPQKPRKAVKVSKSSSPAKSRTLLNQTRKRALDAQRAILQRTKNQSVEQKQEKQYQARQSDIQNKTRYVR